MLSKVLSPTLLLQIVLLFSCMISMHACDARRLSIPSFKFFDEHQKPLEYHSKPETEVRAEGESRESLFTLKVTDARHLTTGDDDLMSPSSQIYGATECKKAMRRQVGEVTGETRSRDVAVDDDVLDPVDTNRVGENGDAVVMDYAQPHRKPPIHNEKP
ncbi:hypothetical protein SAY86_020000 [Trapa natans]|uniref:Uncharacterized protein n=1 Tax=Trapa natans TaxID=22666 RepID=A0AAN7LLW2_TRANT|nr:hypothetical protein SAY86_020000 [Trapa natans]